MKVNVVTCEYIDFDQHQFHKFFCHVKLLICKSQCSHMWVHWPKCLKISFLSKRYLISFVISYRLFVVFNNANAVSAEMWVWGFGNHSWNKSLLSSHSSATRDLTRLLYHLWFPKPHTHISYSQHLHSDLGGPSCIFLTWGHSSNLIGSVRGFFRLLSNFY